MKKAVACFLVCILLLFPLPRAGMAESTRSDSFPSLLPEAETVLYVMPGGTSTSCASWAEACDLQTALNAAVAGDEVWVAQGTYTPSTTNRNSFFTLHSGVAMYGGFTGTETSLDQRDWVANPTILSGEIGDPGSQTDNSVHILSAYNTNADTLLDGFTIRDGYNTDDFASGLYAMDSQATFTHLLLTNNHANQGGAVLFMNGSPKLTDSTISDNFATWGAGVYTASSSPTFTDLTIMNNTASTQGGGIYNMNSNPTLTRVLLESNSTTESGGGVYSYGSNLVLTDVTFRDNQTSVKDDSVYNGGGGMFNFGPPNMVKVSVVLTNVTFTGNTSADDGGGLYNLRDVNTTMTNVTFTGNSAVRGGGFANTVVCSSVLNNVTISDNTATNGGGAIHNESSVIWATNTLVWGNSTPLVAVPGTTLSFSYSLVEGGCPALSGVSCSNLVTTNPLLQPLADNGGFTPTQALPAGSSAIDKGDPRLCPARDQRGYYRPINGDATPGALCDIGAYEYGSFLLQGPILYAKPGGLGYCSSWADACDLQTALDHAEPGYQIWVKQGTHLPTFPSNVSDPRTASFTLKPDVAVYGGFSGTETELSQRDWVNHLTVLSGNIGTTTTITDNSYHVVITSGISASTILDGFTILGGNATGSADADKNGGGLYSAAGSPTLTNLVIRDNHADLYGGGMYLANGNPTLSRVLFRTNTALQGGGMHNYQSTPVLSEVEFSMNQVDGNVSGGGGMYNNNSSPVLNEVIFSENVGDWWGGGMANFNSSNPILSQVLFNANHAEIDGGGIANKTSSNPTLVNVTFTKNTALEGGGMYSDDHCYPSLSNVTLYKNTATTGGGILNHYYSHSTLGNSILWGNSPDQILEEIGSSTNATYSDIDQDGYAGSNGNIRVDPRLAALSDNGGFSQTHALGPGSPAIDTGNPTACPAVDQRDYLRPMDGNADGSALCDMGAYEAASRPGYILTLTNVGNGSVVPNPDQDYYKLGSALTLTATAQPGWTFASWSGNASGTDNPLTLTVAGDTAITATFTQNLYTLQVTVSPTEAGSVSVSPDQTSYHLGDELTLTATAQPGWTFAGWSGNASGTDNPLSITVAGDTAITATFTQNLNKVFLPLILR